MSFSNRMGLREKSPIQIESMDEALRNSLFNVARPFLLEGINSSISNIRRPFVYRFNRMWSDFFKLPLHKSPASNRSHGGTEELVYKFFEEAEWNLVFDLVEFLVSLSDGSLSASFNNVLQREVSGYRILNGLVVPISDSVQIGAIQSGLDSSVEFNLAGVNNHLSIALRLMSDREQPDYRNSIKESISAIESLVSVITKQKRPDLKDALNKLESEEVLHPALKSAFNKLYGWTSDESGVRHALMEESRVDFADAQFMLVASSAFIHFMIAKISP